MPTKQADSIRKDFLGYLGSIGLSSISHKNYKSDLTYFISWTILKIRSVGAYVETLTEIVPFLCTSLSQEFRNYMIENSVPVKTINRRLSTLRHLSKFLLDSHIIDHGFTDGIENVSLKSGNKQSVSPVFNNFKSHLEDKKVSPNTIKNYLSDIRHFLTWLESNQHTTELTN